MSEGNIEDLTIRKAEEHRNTEHLVIDIGGARAHISLADEQAAVTVHDSDCQASIILDGEQNVDTVTHPEEITCVERTEEIIDPVATTSSDSV